MRYDACLFDLDGTLLDTLGDLTAAVNHVMTAFGYPTHDRMAVRAMIGNGIRKLIERALPNGAADPRFEDALRAFETYYTAHCNVRTRPFGGVDALLQALQARGIRLAIVSNKNDAAVKALARLHFADTIPVAIGASDTVRRKPAPDTALAALRALGCDASRALYIGDSDVDKQTADNAGMDCALVTWGYRDRPLLESMRPNALISAPAELLSFIAKEDLP